MRTRIRRSYEKLDVYSRREAFAALPMPVTTWMQGLRVGDALWLSTPCDFSGELALRLKTAARERDLAAAVTSFHGREGHLCHFRHRIWVGQ